jgi:hypothetical protein
MSANQMSLTRACIESHLRMITYHRKRIVELSRLELKEPDFCMECFDYEIINESGRSRKD